jgi:site-specific recombinase XerD
MPYRLGAGLAHRTVHNHFANLVSFLKWARREKIARKGDWPVPAGARLVFPAPEGGPNKHMLRRLKEVAKRAGMDPDSCWLHKFRASFATHALQGGIDLRTVQAWMGHTDLASTMRYLRLARGEKVQAQVEALWA